MSGTKDEAPPSNHASEAKAGAEADAALASKGAGSAASQDPGRRRFMIAGMGVCGAGLAGAVAVPGLGLLAHPLSHEITSKLTDFLPAGKEGGFGSEPIKVDLYADRSDAWSRVRQVKVGSAWVLEQGGELIALSTVCPHLGCPVDWDGSAKKFKCPCHTSSFEPSGAYEEGPAPRGMDRLDVQRADGLVQIRFQRFKQGVADKETL